MSTTSASYDGLNVCLKQEQAECIQNNLLTSSGGNGAGPVAQAFLALRGYEEEGETIAYLQATNQQNSVPAAQARQDSMNSLYL
jgi:hypothetical protein